MPPLNPMSSVSVSGSSSRKRSFTAITRSGSRSSTSEAPSKRRRRAPRPSSIASNTTTSLEMPVSPIYNSRSQGQRSPASPAHSPTSPLHNYGTPTSSPQPPAARFEGDGLDFRAPTMTTLNHASRTIDLTVDDDTSSPTPSQRISIAPSQSPAPQRQLRRAPIFRGRQVEIIDLSDSEDYDDEDELNYVPEQTPPRYTRPEPVRLSSSPDVEFVSARPAQANPGNRPALRQNAAVQVPQQAQGDRATFGDMLRRGTQFMFQNLNAAGFAIPAVRPVLQQPINPNPDLEPDNFVGLQFDYLRPAFAMGTRESETPQLATEPYKAPPEAREGFTRDLDEEEILLCPYCEDELASGEGDVKQQVWIIKQCGHVYCGACATTRPVHGNKRDTRRAKNRQTNSFRACTVDGCGKPVTGKGSMFQIYL